MNAATIPLDKIGINFVWSGENTCEDKTAKKVELIFNNAKTKIYVELPERLHADSVKKLPFFLSKEGQKIKKTSTLLLSAEQVNNFTLKAQLFSKNGEPEIQEVIVNLPNSTAFGTKYNLALSMQDTIIEATLRKDSIESAHSPLAMQMYTNLLKQVEIGRALCKDIEIPAPTEVCDLCMLERLSNADLQSLYEEKHTLLSNQYISLFHTSVESTPAGLNRYTKATIATEMSIANIAHILQARGVNPQKPTSPAYVKAQEELKHLKNALIGSFGHF